MSEEKDSTTEETAEESVSTEETPVAETPAAPVAVPEDDGLGGLPWKERLRVLKSRKSGAGGPEQSPEELQAARLKARAQKARARRKRRGDAKTAKAATAGEPKVGTPPAEHTRTGKPKTRKGLVVSSKANKTITVQIDTATRHPVYEKIVRQRHKIHVHDERNEASEGDVVSVIETRKLSKTKHWLLVEVVEKVR